MCASGLPLPAGVKLCSQTETAETSVSVNVMSELPLCSLQAGSEEHHPDCVSAEDFRPKSCPETAAQSSGHCAVWTTTRCV